MTMMHIEPDVNPFALGVPYVRRLGFSLYTRINMTSGIILHKCLVSSIYYKNRTIDRDDDFTVNMCFQMRIISYFVSSVEKLKAGAA